MHQGKSPPHISPSTMPAHWYLPREFGNSSCNFVKHTDNHFALQQILASIRPCLIQNPTQICARIYHAAVAIATATVLRMLSIRECHKRTKEVSIDSMQVLLRVDRKRTTNYRLRMWQKPLHDQRYFARFIHDKHASQLHVRSLQHRDSTHHPCALKISTFKKMFALLEVLRVTQLGTILQSVSMRFESYSRPNKVFQALHVEANPHQIWALQRKMQTCTTILHIEHHILDLHLKPKSSH